MTDTATKTQNEITVTRQLNAPRELVYRMWVEPEHFAVWFGAELVVPLDTVEMDVRPGGMWKATMLREGGNLPFAGQYVELDPPARIVMTFDDPDNVGSGTNEDVQTLEVTFTERDGGTEICLRQSGLMGEGMPEGLLHGYGTFMDTLERHLATLAD
jgi:uncharacterized protein YndB with AHSA1/START domain